MRAVKIVLFPHSMLPIHGGTLTQRPIGGMETAVIRLGEALETLGHDVRVITTVDNPPLSSPLYLPLRAVDRLGPVDVLIAVREWAPLYVPIDAKRRFLWTGDSYDQPQTIGIGDKRIAGRLDGLLCVSNWHADELSARSGFPRDRTFVLPNGVYLPYFSGRESRTRKRLMYSSTPYRGLRYMPHIFRKIREKHPDAEFHVFSDYAVYSDGRSAYYQPAVKEWEQLKKELELAGCVLHGNIPQEQLAREFMRSSVLTYPNIFAETSCITALEAQAGGCVVLSSRLGALPETVGDRGVLIPGSPEDPAYLAAFIDALDRLLSDDQHWTALSQAGLQAAEGFAWNRVAATLTDLLAEK